MANETAPAPAPSAAPAVVPAAFSGGFTQLHRIAVCGFGAALGLAVLCRAIRNKSQRAEDLAQYSAAHALPTRLVKLLPSNVAALSLSEVVLLIAYAVTLALYLKE